MEKEILKFVEDCKRGDQKACEILDKICYQYFKKEGIINKEEKALMIGGCRTRLVNRPRDINFAVNI